MQHWACVAKQAELADAFGDLGRVDHVYSLAAPAEDCFRKHRPAGAGALFRYVEMAKLVTPA